MSTPSNAPLKVSVLRRIAAALGPGVITVLATLKKRRNLDTLSPGQTGLPFTTLTDQRRGIHYGTVDEQTAGEVVWTQETEPIGLWATYELPTLQPAA